MAFKAQYKLINPKFHCGMGNVRAVITDRKFIKDKSLFMAELVTASDSVQCHFEAYQNKVQNLHWRMPISKSLKFGKSELQRIHNRYYYAFGSPLYGRKYTPAAGSYRFGFNTQEKVDEISGEGNHNTAEFWEYDTRLGRRWNVDPIDNAWESPYACFAGNPILFNDINGDVAGKPDHYLDENGNYLGEDQAKTQEIRFTFRKTWEESKKINNKEDKIQYLQKNSLRVRDIVTRGSIKFLEIAQKLATKMYELSGYSLEELDGGKVNIFYDKYACISPGASTSHNSIDPSVPIGKFRIGINVSEMTKTGTLRTLYDYYNLFVHERKGHGDDFLKKYKYKPEGNSDIDWNWERRATRLQVMDASWAKTSIEFKIYIFKCYGYNNKVFTKAEQQLFFGRYGAFIKDYKGQE